VNLYDHWIDRATPCISGEVTQTRSLKVARPAPNFRHLFITEAAGVGRLFQGQNEAHGLGEKPTKR